MVKKISRATSLRSICRQVRLLTSACLVTSLLAPNVAIADEKSAIAREELEYGTVLYELYKKDYFSALVNHSYVSSKKNTLALSEHGQLLNGGMLLSYGVPEKSEKIFNQMLNQSETELTRNGAWYYLAKLFYSKSQSTKARTSLARVKGQVPKDLHIEYHYLSTLIGNDGNHLDDNRKALENIKEDLPQYPYFLFNIAIRALNDGDIAEAKQLLTEVKDYAYLGEEYEVLTDRAKHGLSQLAASQGDLLLAWQHLSNIRTTGLYSNRALLSYAWAAIKLKQYKQAIPALQILDSRSIALPEVQEAKVLLAHLYEQDGSKRNALKQNVIAQNEYRRGLAMIDKARSIIKLQDVPREFISNLENVVRETDWYGERPEVDYQNLTPFLIDLLASNNFNEALKELVDLYAIENNLKYWLMQGEQHLIILKASDSKEFTDKTKEHINTATELTTELNIKDTELRLLLLSLEEDDQERFIHLLDSTQAELDKLKNKVKSLSNVTQSYQTPKHYSRDIEQKQKTLKIKLKTTHTYIVKLEKVVRKLVNIELDQHAARMSYYSAQARLAKARLYDETLLNLDSAKKRVQPNNAEAISPGDSQ